MYEYHPSADWYRADISEHSAVLVMRRMDARFAVHLDIQQEGTHHKTIYIRDYRKFKTALKEGMRQALKRYPEAFDIERLMEAHEYLKGQ